MRTYSPKPAEITRSWYVIDAEGMVLGRLATEAARLLRGKHRPYFAPHVDTGDHVIVINADKIVMTSNKADQKFAYRHSGYPGGLRSTSYAELLAEDPVELVTRAVRGMVPKNRLGRQQMTQAQGLRRPDAPARGPEPAAPRHPRRPPPGRVEEARPRCPHRSPRPPAAASRPSPASASVRAPAPSRSTSAPSRSTSPRPPTAC